MGQRAIALEEGRLLVSNFYLTSGLEVNAHHAGSFPKGRKEDQMRVNRFHESNLK